MKTSKVTKYAVQQHLIQNELIYLLGLEGNGFYLCDLDNNLELQDQIMNLVPEIRKYFCHVNITGLIYPQRCKRPWLSIVRGILKNKYHLKYQACRYPSKSLDKSSSTKDFTMRYYIEPIEQLTSNKQIPNVVSKIQQITLIKLNLHKKQKKINPKSNASITKNEINKCSIYTKKTTPDTLMSEC